MNVSKTKPTASSVSFATEARIHVAIGVRDVEASTAFYQLLFQQPASKEKPGYAKFEVEYAPVNFALNQIAEPMARDRVSHFGIQVKEHAEISAAVARFEAAGVDVLVEESVSCCYAVQDKAWVTDPDGNKWEIFLVLEDAEQYASDGSMSCCVTDDGGPCCDDTDKAQGCCA